jgi:uncharacterized protein YcbX
MAGTLAAIHVYPVKSCGAVALDQADIVSTGLRGDRLFQVVDVDGNPVTQRQQPRLATVRPAFNGDGLTLAADGQEPLTLTVPVSNDTSAMSLLGVRVDAGDAGDDAASWFSELLGAPVRLVAMTDESEYRLPIPGIDMPLSWADAASVHVVNSASLRWLNERADEPFGMDRFRPNLTVDAGEAWVEDTWREFSVGTAQLGLGLAWPRCAVPQVDQVDGTRHNEPAKVLKAHRWCSNAESVGEAVRPLLEGNALFGIGCGVHSAGATIAIGDEVEAHTTGDRVIPAPF